MNQTQAPPTTPAAPRDTVERTARIPESLAGMRLDRAVAEVFADFSRSRLAEWIKSGQILVNGQIARPRDPVDGGETLTLRATLEAQVDAAPEKIPLDIVFEDKHLIVVNKPAGLVVHPGAGNATGTLQNALLHHDPKLDQVPRAGIVHRLDKDTSGLMVVARTLAAHARLVEQLSDRDIHRQYEALVLGPMIAGGSVEAAMDRHPADRLKMGVVEGGRPAVTHYRVRERFRAHTLLQVNLETGRTHQIRVHMAHIRHPLLGDPLYGGGLKLPKAASPTLVEILRGFKRQALHAERLAFEHPVTGKTLEFTAPRPADMEAVVQALRADVREHTM